MHSITFTQPRIARCLDQSEASLRTGETVELLRLKRMVAHFVPRNPWPFTDEEETLDAKEKRDHNRKINTIAV
jgi:hypothetical protein